MSNPIVSHQKILLAVGIVITIITVNFVCGAPDRSSEFADEFTREIEDAYFRAVEEFPGNSDTDFPENEPLDELSCNLDCDLEDALEILISKKDSVLKRSRILKTFYLADFVFAAFSYEFLYEDEYLKKEVAFRHWDSLPLFMRYDIGNQNVSSLHCGYRTAFFLSLLDTLTHYEYFTVNAAGKHTYPVVNVGRGRNEFWIIADPYDPFIALNKKNKALDVFSLIAKKEARFFRTERAFGSSRLLVRHKLLVDEISGRKEYDEFKHLTDSFNTHFRAVTGKTMPQMLTYMPEKMKKLPDNERYAYAIEDFGRPDTFNFVHFFDEEKSYYLPKGATATIPKEFENNERVKRVVQQFNSDIQEPEKQSFLQRIRQFF